MAEQDDLFKEAGEQEVERFEGKVRLISKYRRPGGLWRIATIGLPVLGILLALVELFFITPFGYAMVPFEYYFRVIGFFLPLLFIWIPIRKGLRGSTHVPWYDAILAALACGIPLWFSMQYYGIWTLGWEGGAPPFPFALGLIFVLLVLEAARRAGGWFLFAAILLIASYPLYAESMPIRILWGPSMSFHELISKQALSTLGIIGIPLHVFANIIIGYLVFAVTIQACGAGQFFTELAQALVGKTRSGNAKVAVLASSMFATISGAAVPNVLTTGSFTIPAMKKEGLPAYFAGAVEATASSAGGITPPVMGSIAFLMAEFTGRTYAEVCIIAAVPAVLFYLCLFSQIDARAARMRLKPPPRVDVPAVWLTLVRNFHILAGVAMLITVLFIFRLVEQAPWVSAAFVVLLTMVRKETRLHPKDFIKLIESVGRTLSDLCSILASVGMIVGAMLFTGIGLSFPNHILSVAGGNILAILIIGALINLILGCGLTASAIYIMLAIVFAPSLVTLGLHIMAVHFFILYIGEFSHTTPPVALASFAAASVADAPFMKVCWQGMKLGVGKYLLPFIFVLSPALILQAPVDQILWAIVTTAIGFVVIGGALEGYFWFLGKLTMPVRFLLFAFGFLAVLPAGIVGMEINLYGQSLFAGFFILALILKRTGNPVSKYVLEP